MPLIFDYGNAYLNGFVYNLMSVQPDAEVGRLPIRFHELLSGIINVLKQAGSHTKEKLAMTDQISVKTEGYVIVHICGILLMSDRLAKYK